MRILFIGRSSIDHPAAGGMERVAWEVARGLARTDDVTYLTSRISGLPSTYERDGVHVVTVPAPPGRYSIPFWWSTARFNEPFDCGVSVSAGGTARILAGKRTPMLFQMHGTAWRELKAQLATPTPRTLLTALRILPWVVIDIATYRKCEGLVACAEPVAGELKQFPYRGRLRDVGIRTIVNAVDTDFYRPPTAAESSAARTRLGIPADARVAVSTSRLVKQKGVDHLIAGLPYATGLHAVIVGDGPETDTLIGMSRELDVADRVHLLGAGDRLTVRNALWAGDVLALPVRRGSREGLPLTALEAAACGLAVVASPGIRWDPAFVGCVQECELDPQAFAHALITAKPRARFPQTLTMDSAVATYRELLIDISTKP